MTICALPLCHPLCSSLLSGLTIFVTGVATAARGENGGQIITAMGREAVGADLIEDQQQNSATHFPKVAELVQFERGDFRYA